MAIQGAPRRLRGQNPNAPQIPSFSPNNFGGQLGNMQIGGMGGMMGNQPLANNVNNNRVQGNTGGGLRSGGPQAPIPITDANREDMARLQKEQEQKNLMGGAKLHTFGPELYQQQQGNMGGGGLMGGAGASNSPYANSAFSDMPVKPRLASTDMPFYIDPITGQQGTGGSTTMNYRNNLKSYFDNNAGAQDYYNQLNPSNQPPMAGNTGGGGFSAQVITQGDDGQYYTDLSMTTPLGGNYRPEPNQNPALDYQDWLGDTTNNGVNNMANPYTTDVLTGPAASTSGPSDTMAYGGALLGGLLGNDLSGALQAAGGYYAGQQGIEGAMATGQAGLGLGEAMGKRAYDQSQFRPFGVTSNLANVQTTPEGGVNLNLSPEQQAMQQQLLGQSRGLFGQVGADPAAAQSALYEQIRATQQPEEERQRLQMQENLFSSGRGGVQTAMYGGTPEQMAYEKARQESMLNANLAARTQSQAEQLQAANLGGMLQQAGYDPQRQAIDLFGASGVPSQLAAKGQLGGAELQSQAGGRGLESYMQGANMANLLQQQQLQGLMTGAVGKPLTAQEQLMNAMIGRLGGTPIEAGGGMLGGVLDWGKELLGFGEDKPNFTLNPSEIDKLSDAEKEQALYDLFN